MRLLVIPLLTLLVKRRLIHAKISSFHLANEEKFNRLQELMISGYKEFKAHPIIKRIKYAV